MDVEDRFITVMGLRTHYLCSDAGSGSPVVLLHGGGTDSARLSWGDVVGPLAAAGHRVLAPDLPGYGESDRPDIRNSTEFYLSFIGAWLDALRLEPASLAGLSMGGALALGTALDQPRRVAWLVPVDSYGLQRKVAMHRLSYLLVKTPGIMEASLSLMRTSPATVRAGLRNVVHDPAALSPALVDEANAESRRPHAGRAFTSYQRDEILWGGLRTVYMDRLAEIKIPVLLVHGRQDALVPLACAEEAQRRIAGAQLQVIDGAGHWSQREKPAEFLAAVTAFLQD